MILIIGGAGFLGCHFRDVLRVNGEACVIVTRDVARAKSYSAIGERFVSADDFHGKLATDVIADVSAIVYLASSSVPSTFADRPWLELGHVVAPVSEFMLKFGSINQSAKMIFISSGGTIYGNPSVNPVDEGQPIAPISAYGLGKQIIEQTVQFVGRTKGMSYNILRVANPVGRHHRNVLQGVVSTAIRSLLAGAEFNIYGDGSSVRDYVDADDVADAIWAACSDRKFNDRIWNVGSGIGYSVREILEQVEATSKRKLKIRNNPSRAADVRKIVLNCDLIARDLGWFPRRDIAVTIEQLWNYQSNIPNG